MSTGGAYENFWMLDPTATRKMSSGCSTTLTSSPSPTPSGTVAVIELSEVQPVKSDSVKPTRTVWLASSIPKFRPLNVSVAPPLGSSQPGVNEFVSGTSYEKSKSEL
eukprot:659207-Rhodomonas_salina.1